MKLSQINIFPIKSMGSLTLKEASVLPAGLQYDRRWMLLNEAGKFMTQRDEPLMALIQFEWAENGFNLQYKDVESSVFIPFAIPDSPIETVQVWEDKVAARRMSEEINTWFTQVIGSPCQLVRIEENAIRKNSKGKPDKISSFADSMPFLIVGEASLHDLNQRLEQPVPMSRFRANFIFSGGNAFEEDHWSKFRIGTVHFKKHKKCGRCTVITIDQQTGIKMGEEPLATLSTYRKENRKVHFGMYATLVDSQQSGQVHLNDEVVPIYE